MTPPPTTHPRAYPAASAFAEALAQVVVSIVTYLFHRPNGLRPNAVLVLNRISRPLTRIQSLLARLAAGTWRAPKPRPPDTSRSEVATKATAVCLQTAIALPRPKTPYISQSKGWIGQAYGWYIRGYFAQLDHALTRPETQALLADLPPEALKSLGRNLRPMCRMFGIAPPECLRLPPRERKPRPKKPRKPRAQKPRWRTPYLAPYPTTSPTPWRIIKSKTQKFWG